VLVGLSQLDGILSLRPVRPVTKLSESGFNSVDISTSPAPVASKSSIILGLLSLVTLILKYSRPLFSLV